MPRRPSSLHITLAVPNRPLYIWGWPTWMPLWRLMPPWACSLVLMTSRGQVTIPEVNPPIAPASALNWESEAFIAQRSKRDRAGSGMLVGREA